MSRPGFATSSATEADTPTQVNRQLFREIPRIPIRRQRRGIEIDLYRWCVIYAQRQYSHWAIRILSLILQIRRSTVDRICQRGPNNFAPPFWQAFSSHTRCEPPLD